MLASNHLWREQTNWPDWQMQRTVFIRSACSSWLSTCCICQGVDFYLLYCWNYFCRYQPRFCPFQLEHILRRLRHFLSLSATLMAYLPEKIIATLAIDYRREVQARGRTHSVFHWERRSVPAESNLALLLQSRQPRISMMLPFSAPLCSLLVSYLWQK